ncbi:MAG: ankyrin repeat domain-containing protein [Anaerolineae bacterium]|nr:ankyrin repeat domain-containing protein [Phycisphaerae bacterium]
MRTLLQVVRNLALALASSVVWKSVSLLMLLAIGVECVRMVGAPRSVSTDIEFWVFHRAVFGNDLETFKSLVDRMPDLNARDEQGFTPLALAARYGSNEAIEMLLSKGAGVDEAHSKLGTPLMLALGNGHLHSARLLLARGANVNARCEGRDPLTVAVVSNSLASVELLLHAGADPRAIGRPCSLLTIAAQNDCPEMMRQLLELGVDPNIPDADGSPPLIAAVVERATESLQMLLQAGADPDQIGVNGQTPRDVAVMIDRPEILSLLREFPVRTGGTQAGNPVTSSMQALSAHQK